jgi:hypothetical protein
MIAYDLNLRFLFASGPAALGLERRATFAVPRVVRFLAPRPAEKRFPVSSRL